MKALTAIFTAAVIGIVFSFGMTIYTGYQEKKSTEVENPESIPTPAMAQ